jgi:twitching motility protein PilT
MAETIQIDKLLEVVSRRSASDLHLVVGRPPVLRLHGHLRDLQTKVLEPEDTQALMKSITPERIQQELEEQGSGDFGFKFRDECRFRVAIFKQKGFVSLVLRRIPSKLLTFEQIGLPAKARDVCHRPRGMFLVTGPTGSGKTTTLATMINYINMNMDRHIITMEDPIEYYHDHKKSVVVQREIGIDVPSFSEGLRRALRQDPDVILVGEMRDLATISAAISAAETGHLVFGTLHTSGAASTINRIIDAFPTDQQEQIRVQMANNLIAVLSQVLCPRVDTDGMIAGYEFMFITPGIQNLIRENKVFRIDSEIQTGKKHGMVLLDDYLFTLFQTGKIAKEEAIEKSKSPIAMRDKFQRAGIEVEGFEGEDGGGGEEGGGGAPKPDSPTSPSSPPAANGTSEAERQAQIAKNRARLASLKQAS